MYPKIGIIAREQLSLNKEIVDVIHQYNGIPIGILADFNSNPDLEFNKLTKIIDFCDAIILQGGKNFYDIDQKIVHYLYQKNIPTLGICLGMQEMGVMGQGKLGTLPSNHHQQQISYVHPVNIRRDSLLYQILQEDQILVNSRHSDYLINTNLFVGATSDDGVIEEVEDSNKHFFLGVQWHPESIFQDKNSMLLFEYFFSILKTNKSHY